MEANEGEGLGSRSGSSGDWLHRAGFRCRFRTRPCQPASDQAEPVSLEVDNRPTAIARIKGRLNLDQSAELSCAQLERSLERRHMSPADRMPHAKWVTHDEHLASQVWPVRGGAIGRTARGGSRNKVRPVSGSAATQCAEWRRPSKSRATISALCPPTTGAGAAAGGSMRTERTSPRLLMTTPVAPGACRGGHPRRCTQAPRPTRAPSLSRQPPVVPAARRMRTTPRRRRYSPEIFRRRLLPTGRMTLARVRISLCVQTRGIDRTVIRSPHSRLQRSG